MKSARVFLIQGFPHSDKLLFSRMFMLILIAQNGKTSLCSPHPAGFSNFNICALEGSTSGLVFNLKPRQGKDFPNEVKNLPDSHRDIKNNNKVHHICSVGANWTRYPSHGHGWLGASASGGMWRDPFTTSTYRKKKKMLTDQPIVKLKNQTLPIEMTYENFLSVQSLVGGHRRWWFLRISKMHSERQDSLGKFNFVPLSAKGA